MLRKTPQNLLLVLWIFIDTVQKFPESKITSLDFYIHHSRQCVNFSYFPLFLLLESFILTYTKHHINLDTTHF